MENENKSAPRQQKQGDKKRHTQRPKGYFIEPNAQKNAAAPAASEGNATQRNAERSAQQKPQEGASRQGHKRHRDNRPKDGEKVPQSASTAPNGNASAGTNTGAKPNAATPEQTKAQHDGEGRSKHSRNRHRSKPKNKPATAEGTVEAQATAEKNTSPAKQNEKAAPSENARKQKKKYERPQTKPSDGINTADYEQVRFPSAASDKKIETTASKANVPMIEVVGVRFKSTGKTYYFAPNGKKLRRGEHAIVETARGLEYGDVAMGNTMVKESDTVPPLRPVVRVATPADIKHHEENKKKEDEAFAICNERILAHKLDMKLIDAQFTFDNSKLLFYFTSSGRVDFRDLVKDLAGVFRTRIELRQIGIRDEAKIMGGVGMCGRPLCCTLFLSDFGQVSIKMAKEQNLSLNCAKISGICGRLMCCLRYEHETYEYEIKRTPPVDSLVQTADGTGTVTEISPLRGTVKVRLTASPENPPKVYKREDVVMLQKKHIKGN